MANTSLSEELQRSAVKPRRQREKVVAEGEDLKVIAGRFPEDVHTQFKVLCAEKGLKVQQGIAAALNLWFKQNKRDQIA